MSENTKTKLAIFDLDGTLFNTDEVNYHAYAEAMRPFGVKLDHDLFIKEFNGKHYKTFAPALLGGDEHLEEVHESKKKLYASFLKYAGINTHLFDVIKSIKGDYHIALVTTASSKNVNDILSYFNVKDLFDLCLTQEDITKAKPDPEGFVKAMEYYKATPENTVIYEDSDVGIEAARRTGASVIIVDCFNF